MNVRMKEAICNLKVGAVVSVSTDRGSLWIQKGYAEYAGGEEPKIEKKPVPALASAPAKNEVPEPPKPRGRPAMNLPGNGRKEKRHG